MRFLSQIRPFYKGRYLSELKLYRSFSMPIKSYSCSNSIYFNRCSRNFFSTHSEVNVSKESNDDQNYEKSPTDVTYISRERAMECYALTRDDLLPLESIYFRTSVLDSSKQDFDEFYLKSDVKDVAMKKYGSWSNIQSERHMIRAQNLFENEKIRKMSYSVLWKKYQKNITKSSDKNDVVQQQLQSSLRVIGVAILGNTIIFCMKFITSFYTGSSSIFSESLHSLADILNQVFLGAGIYVSLKERTEVHPYGWGPAKYVYSLISGMGVLFLGAGVSMCHGFLLLFKPHTLEALPYGMAVIGLSFIIEAFSMLFALREIHKLAKLKNVTLLTYITNHTEPTSNAVLMEDSAAVLGLIAAAVSLYASHITGSHLFDALGSISIGAILAVVATYLIRKNIDALIGRSIDHQRLLDMIEYVESDKVVRSVHDVKATDMGSDQVRFKAEINFDGNRITEVYLSTISLKELLRNVQNIKTEEELEEFLKEHGSGIIDELGTEVDRLERKIIKKYPDVKHVDLEIL